MNGAVYQLQYDLVRDFAPIALVATGPMMMATKKAFPASDLKEMIGWLKANPDKASAGTGGVGAGLYAGIFFQKLTGTKFQHAPIATAPAMRDLVAGQIDLC